jgi:hypothetical protein
MFSRKTLAVVTLLGAMVTPAGAGDRAQSPDFNPRSAIPALPDDAQVAPSDRLEGQVLAVDVGEGRMLVTTDIGMVAVRAEPADLAQIKVGDIVEVVMMAPEPDSAESSDRS